MADAKKKSENKNDKPGDEAEPERQRTTTGGILNLGRDVGVLALTTGAIGKWKKNLTADRRERIKTLFTVPRNDPQDPFKPNSDLSIKIMGEQPLKKPLPEEQLDMLQTVAVHYDYCLPLDIVEWPHAISDVSPESREQLEKLPTWLKALIMLRYDKILSYFGNKTHHFLRMLANRVDYQRSVPMKLFDFNENDDEEDIYTINKRFIITKDDIEAPITQAKKKTSLQGTDLFKVAHAIVLWRLPKSARAEWDPNVVERCAATFKNAMLTQPSPTEIAMAVEDEKAFVVSDESDDEVNLYKPQSWEEIVTEKPDFHKKIENQVEKEFMTIPYEFRHLEEEDCTPKIKRRRERMKKREQEEKELKKASKGTCKKVKKLFSSRQTRLDKQEVLVNRGLYRRYSRIWKKRCPIEEIAPTKKRAHHFRADEGFHAYIVALVSSHTFKAIIMLVIVLNAVVLAVETGVSAEENADLFEVLDDWFLSVYLMEFIVKVYAHPQRYWKNGFNVFDFLILLVSFLKAITDWISTTQDFNYLKVLVIVRALRILRGVSLNVQIQVLVTALVETLKTHVLSILILLILIMYIAAIIAHYLFAEKLPWRYKNIGMGMLNLFSFVTMDGWTEILDDFEDKGMETEGRIFCLLGIVLGNFIFSNIFIAIIIMQISEVTDSFRERQTEEREAIVKRKKDTVYRRQKLDMRQLLSRQRLSMSVDFFYLASQFQKLLRHDDLVDIRDAPFSPIWIDCLQKCSQRCLHTSNVLMNLHRQIADNLLELYEMYQGSKRALKPIRRARYNRCVRLKSKLHLLRNEFYRAAVSKNPELEDVATRILRIKLPPDFTPKKPAHKRILVKQPPANQSKSDTKGPAKTTKFKAKGAK